MGYPGMLSNQVPSNPNDYVNREIADLKRAMRELGPSIAESFRGTVADLTAAIAAIAALVGSQISVTSIPAHTVTNFATIAGGNTIESTRTITVPSGFTTAIVMANAFATVVNSGGSAMNLQVNPGINGSLGPGNLDRGVPAGGFGMVDASAVQSITGLSGGATFDVVVWVSTSSACAADYGNQAMVSGAILWVR